jgi:thiol-disulfide isomerase/thioredoxin
VRPLRLLVWLVSAAAVAALIVFGLGATRSASVGQLAPGLPREHLAGPPATLADVLSKGHGRGALVTFWASWCGPCAREAPAMERFSQSVSGRGRLVGVDWSDPVLSGARSFISRYGWTFPNLRDAEGTVGAKYHLTVLPTTFVIDASGRVRAVLRGPQQQSSLAQALASVSRG